MDLCFSPSSSTEAGSYKLLELPPDLCKLIENAINTMAPLKHVFHTHSPHLVLTYSRYRLKIKGKSGEDAVLCTVNKTFSIRSVTLSNTVLVVTPPPDASSMDFADDAVVIRDQVTEILELTPIVPKLHTLTSLLKGNEYDGDQDDEDRTESAEAAKLTYEDALQIIQASDMELDRGMRAKHILNINGELRPIAPSYLDRLLELFLNGLVALSLSYEAASVEVLSSSLADDHEVPRSISTQVMSWFGEIKDGKWKMDTSSLIQQVGLGILRHHLHEPIYQGELITKWKSLVGDAFESKVDLTLLEGNYLASVNDPESLMYFPASTLPVDPARRCAELFLTRPRWKGKDISPFLADIAVDSKERDKLLLKYARAATDAEGVWYTARTQYSG